MKAKRLRDAIDDAFGNKRVSREIIRVADKHEYRLVINLADIANRKSFRDFVAAKRIDPTLGENIFRACSEV